MLLQETKIQLSKAVILRDALTGEPVSSGIRIHSLSGGRIEKKSGGHVLFLNVSEPEIAIEVESPVYQSRKICLKSDQGAELEDVLMYPSAAYPRRAGYTAVRGKAEPGSILQFHMEDEKSVCRLFGNYKKGQEQISFYIKSGIVGAFWYIRRKEDTSGVYFSLKNIAEGSEIYSLKEPLVQNYAIKDTVIYPAQETIADEKGDFYVLFRELPQEECLLYYSVHQEGKEKQGEAQIIQAKENYILEED